jgi:hypothetical protein
MSAEAVVKKRGRPPKQAVEDGGAVKPEVAKARAKTAKKSTPSTSASSASTKSAASMTAAATTSAKSAQSTTVAAKTKTKKSIVEADVEPVQVKLPTKRKSTAAATKSAGPAVPETSASAATEPVPVAAARSSDKAPSKPNPAEMTEEASKPVVAPPVSKAKKVTKAQVQLPKAVPSPTPRQTKTAGQDPPEVTAKEIQGASTQQLPPPAEASSSSSTTSSILRQATAFSDQSNSHTNHTIDAPVPMPSNTPSAPPSNMPFGLPRSSKPSTLIRNYLVAEPVPASTTAALAARSHAHYSQQASQGSRASKPVSSRLPPNPPAPAANFSFREPPVQIPGSSSPPRAHEPAAKLSELPYDELKKQPRYRKASTRYTMFVVSLPFALVTSYLLWEKGMPTFHVCLHAAYSRTPCIPSELPPLPPQSKSSESTAESS